MLAMVLALLLLSSLASAWNHRALLLEIIGLQAHRQTDDVRLVAQSTLAMAEARLMAAANSAQLGALWHPITPCPEQSSARQWQCSLLSMPTPVTGADTQVLLARDVVQAPHVWELRVHARQATAQASLRESVFMPVLAPPPTPVGTMALLLNGCIRESATSNWQICPAAGRPCTPAPGAVAVQSLHVPDENGDGRIDLGELQACLALTTRTLPAAGGQIGPDRANMRTPCNRATWKALFGDMGDDQLRAWSDAQALAGLDTRSTPPRTVYWVDSPADWHEDLGSSEHPVLLVFSAQACTLRCPRIATHSRIVGTVFLDAGCDDNRMRGWQAGQIRGLLAVEAGLPPIEGFAQLQADPIAPQAYRLHWPAGIDARRAQRVPGSFRQTTP